MVSKKKVAIDSTQPEEPNTGRGDSLPKLGDPILAFDGTSAAVRAPRVSSLLGRRRRGKKGGKKKVAIDSTQPEEPRTGHSDSLPKLGNPILAFDGTSAAIRAPCVSSSLGQQRHHDDTVKTVEPVAEAATSSKKTPSIYVATAVTNGVRQATPLVAETTNLDPPMNGVRKIIGGHQKLSSTGRGRARTMPAWMTRNETHGNAGAMPPPRTTAEDSLKRKPDAAAIDGEPSKKKVATASTQAEEPNTGRGDSLPKLRDSIPELNGTSISSSFDAKSSKKSSSGDEC